MPPPPSPRTAIAIISPRMRPFALGLPGAIPLSRVYLRVHFPIDVLGCGIIGAALGALAPFVTLRIARSPEPRAAWAGSSL